MEIEVTVPSVGESITEALLVQWFKSDGEPVEKGDPLFLIETDKITLEVEAEADGILHIRSQEGQNVAIGAVVAEIRAESASPAVAKEPSEAKASESQQESSTPAPDAPDVQRPEGGDLAPSVRRLAAREQVDLTQVRGTGPGNRVTKGDVLLHLESRDALPPEPPPAAQAASQSTDTDPEAVTRETMSPIRSRIADRLLEARQNTAMLTTFNEIDMSRTMEMRNRFKEAFQQKHQVSLGFMSFFTKACVEALKEFPQVNAFVEGKDIVHHHYYHIGVAIGSGKGLVVPVIRHADKLGFAGIEQAIQDYVTKIKENRISLSDMEGGTFTISNGGVYGSLLSTPILNTPQSGILGMHKIEKRPVVVDDEIVIRPMMYVALSYDHRIIDGREAVSFLKRIKACIENPERLILEV
ncbi:MAG TPA: dihydrolipoamide succinyltransferase [Desulfobacteraceae bacterium]|nr:dihydrolipoamide succinyltransferase [Desulfobacteraceae bacterium]